MKSLFDANAVQEITGRIARLTPESPSQWGKMNVAQMLAHNSAWMEIAAGVNSPPRVLVGRIFGRLAKSQVLKNEGPLRRSTPTDPSLIMSDPKDFVAEKQRLLEWIDSFASGGPAQCTKGPHSFFGPMTPTEWATLGYKHLDHHLRQFGV